MLNVEITFGRGVGSLVRARGRRGCAASPPDATGRIRIALSLPAPASLKDAVASLGVPHCEIGTVGGDLAGLDDQVRAGCRVEVGPVAPFFLDDPRFLCDGHLGRLARLLRLLGFDTLHDPGWAEAEVARRGLNEGRTVLSRSLDLLMRRALTRAMLIRADDPFLQVGEVAARFRLAGRTRMFGRCSVCNGPIAPVAKADVLARIPPKTAAWLDVYYECRGCGKLYWEGTHVGGLAARLTAAIGKGPSAS